MTPKSVIFIYRIDDSNSGDFNCCPKDYFGFFGQRYDINDLPDTTDKIVIVGGGGVFHKQAWDFALEIAIRNSYKSILWGAGSNYHTVAYTVIPMLIEKFDLVGLRDWGTKFRWVPCVSCMNRHFDKFRQIENEVVVYEHKDHRLAVEGLPCLNNRASMEEALDFLGSAETVITNTYHGVYWSLLLSRRVVMMKPFSSKFYGIRQKIPIIENIEEWDGSAAEYPNALQECRSANIDFYKDVCKLIGDYL